MHSLHRMKQSIIECIWQKNKSWLTKWNLLIQWFEAVDRNFCQQNRLRDSKNEICRWNGFDVSFEKYFVDRMDQSEKMHFLNTRVLALCQNIFHPQMFWLSCQLFSLCAISQSLYCRQIFFFFLNSSSVEETGGTSNATAVDNMKSLVKML